MYSKLMACIAQSTSPIQKPAYCSERNSGIMCAGLLEDVVHAFTPATLSFPPKVYEMKPDAAEVNSLKAFPFLSQPAQLDALKSELPGLLTMYMYM